MPVKSFVAPVWILGITAFIRLLLTIAAIIAVYNLQSRTNIKLNHTSFIVDLLMVALLWAETFIYWKIRNRIYKRSWVTAHLLLMVIIMIIVPVILPLIPVLVNSYMSSVDSKKVTQIAQRAGYYSFWACIIAGNAFFMATVIKSFQFKPGLYDDTGLMDI